MVDLPSREWRVAPSIIVLKVIGAVLLAVLALTADGRGLFLAGIAALGLAGLAVRDLLARVRLAADHHGVTVITGFSGRHHIPWPQIERIRVDSRARYGTRMQLLELDTGDNIHLFSKFDLGEPVVPVAEVLMRMRP
ncbi:hypothetical protein GCM10009555_106820 [Acrocarpospora macrocephala]|uniref:Low molecular weight protein antigen 6 PH domain-containing protein n=1 Tax=Acrocarpospora macrocephala TaxID=150177 RepID=A0A5M3X1G2_9ACTN|nr:PH domain-containing protein [Acrocarpospora macrocephala]GES14994.1 hypothetical protein Amac_085910 [Acrocarpospora macrocephala]